jgi:hypothetical protein
LPVCADKGISAARSKKRVQAAHEVQTGRAPRTGELKDARELSLDFRRRCFFFANNGGALFRLFVLNEKFTFPWTLLFEMC